MKTFHKIILFFLVLSISLALPSCKDNVLTPVTTSKSADSLTALISALNSKLVTVNAKDNSLQIKLAKFQSTADSLNAISNSNGNYAQAVQYTVYVIDGANSVTGTSYVSGGRSAHCKDCKVAGVDGATVTVASNGQTYSAISSDGRAIFNNLYVAGLATVTITASGYTSCSYTTYFNPKSTMAGNSGIGSVSLYRSNFSGYSNTVTAVAPVSTSGSGTGALFTIVVGNSGNVTSITATTPGSGYKTGDLITFNGSQLCDCSGSVTFQVTSAPGPVNPGQTGTTLNASTNVLILPTAGKNVTTYTGQLYINKSVMDDTLGRLYNNATDHARYLTFVSPFGPYHGIDQTSGQYAQNQYFNANNATVVPGNAITFTNLTTLAGMNFIYGYPTYVSNYYAPYSLNYQFLPGDIISISYTGLTAFATIGATGSYNLVVPSYENNPGTTISTAAGLWYNGGNVIHYQDNYTYLSTTADIGSTNVTLNLFNTTTYAVTKITTYYQETKMFEFYPYIESDNGGYTVIDGYGKDVQTFSSLPGQTVTRNVFFFPSGPIGQ